MKTIIAITGAGWDPVTEARARARGFPIPERTPEMFWSLGTDRTVVSRQMAQFRKLGAEQIFVGMGKPGCSPATVEDHDKKVYGVEISNYGQSPWTKAQVAYITRWGGKPILMPDPHAKGKTCWSTLLKMTPAILAEDWDRIVISAGDYIFRTTFLHSLLEDAKWPSQFWFWTKHSMEFLDREGFMKFTNLLQAAPDWRQSRVWLRRKEWGFPQTVWGERKDVFGWMMRAWIEVDHHAWAAALKLADEDLV